MGIDTIPLRPPSEHRAIARNSHRARGLTLRGNRPYSYATPVAPADVPNDYVDGDADNVAFTDGWGNLDSDHEPFGYRLYGDGVQVRPGAITGGEDTPGSVVCTLPAAYHPSAAHRFIATIGADGSALGTFELQTSGHVVFIGINVGETGATGADGAPGADGTDGTDGSDGAAGPAGGVYIDYIFSTTTTDSDPGNGNLRLSNSNQIAAVTIRADLLDTHGVDATAILDNLDASSSGTKGYIRLFKTTDPTKWIEFTLSARATPAGYRNLTVSEVAASSASPVFANGDPVTLTFTRTGDKGDTGATGATGGAGSTGPTGAAGPAGGLSVDYTFSTTTTDSDPGNGNLRLSNATQTAAVTVRADLLDTHGTDVTALLDNLDAGTSSEKGIIRLFKTNDPTKWIEFSLISRAAPSGYRNLTVSEVAASGASPIFANGDGVTLSFSRTGDKGDTGATGAPGAGGGLAAKLYDNTLAADTATIDTDPTSLAGYDVLEIWIYSRTDEAVTLSGLLLTLNNDNGANYDIQSVEGHSTTAGASSAVAQTSFAITSYGASAPANYFVLHRITIPCYAQTTGYKAGEMFRGIPHSTAASQFAAMFSLNYRSTAAVTRVAISPQTAGKKLKTGSRVLIYGR